MRILSIIYFLYLLWGTGFLSVFFLKESNTFLERNLIRFGIGLAVLPLLLTVCNLLHIPLVWWIFLIIASIGPLLNIKKFKKPVFKPNHKTNLFIYIVLILFSLTLFMHCKGAFLYPWLEDTDSWGHSAGIKYISVEHTMYDPPYAWITKDRTNYSDVPPGSYDALLSLPYSIANNLIWTMKFFNALIVSLGVIFFYFMVKKFTGNKTIALLSTFVFAMIPSYLTHFIWAHSLAVTIFFPAVYCILKIEKDKKWLIPSILIMGSAPVIHPIQAIKLYLLVGIFCFIKFLFNRKLWKMYIPLFIIGGLLSLSWWAPVYLKEGGMVNIMDEASKGVTAESSLMDGLKSMFSPTRGTATRAYTFSDFFFAKGQNLINAPTGWGIVISILLILCIPLLFFIEDIVFHNLKQYSWIIITLLWFLITFLLLNSMTFHLPISLIAFRIWELLAIPVSILIGYTIYSLRIKQKYLTYAIWIILLAGIFLTSGIPKWQVNTSLWGTWFSQTNDAEVTGFVFLPQMIPKGSRVFDASGGQVVVMAFDMDVCEWCEEEMKFGVDTLDYSAVEIHQWLKEHNYQYLIISGRTFNANVRKYGNQTNYIIQEKLYEIQTSNLFKLIYQNEAFILLEAI